MNRSRRFPLSVQPAEAAELPAAFRLLFQHTDARDRETRIANALELVRKGELDPAGVLVCRRNRSLLGAMLCLPVPGASGLVWPPQTAGTSSRQSVEDRLVQATSAWLRERGAKLAQALLLPDETQLAAPLERNGYRHVTSLWYMRRQADAPVQLLSSAQRLTYQSYYCCRDLFHETLWRTYEGSLDCPEVTGVREIGEIIEGHRSQGVYNPEFWWLAFEACRPVGVLLITEAPEWNSWDISYVGIVPEARRRGFGRELTGKALWEVRTAGGAQLTLSVDERNLPARNLYQSLGFEPYDQREVYLAIWNKP